MITHCVVFEEFTVIFQVNLFFFFLERSLLLNVDVFATFTHNSNIITFLCQNGNK